MMYKVCVLDDVWHAHCYRGYFDREPICSAVSMAAIEAALIEREGSITLTRVTPTGWLALVPAETKGEARRLVKGSDIGRKISTPTATEMIEASSDDDDDNDCGCEDFNLFD